MEWIRGTAVGLICAVSALLWWVQALQSPFLNEQEHDSRRYRQTSHEKRAPELQELRQLASDYWLRYADIRIHPLWGEGGRFGIEGPLNHYRLHGKKEGRIYAKISRPEDLEREKWLARAYWQRYPAVASSEVWGENSLLGVLGPRDHYRFFGRKMGLRWGE